GLRAVVADAHGDAAGIKELADVVGVYSGDIERAQRDPLGPGGGAEQPHAGNRGEALAQALLEHELVRMHGLHADGLEVTHRRRPGSKRCGGGRSPARSSVTSVIMEPPVRNAGSDSSTSLRPYMPPMAYGPSILWPENTARSTPSAGRSSGRCGADWQASKS